MTNQIKDGGPAFPEVVTHLDYDHVQDESYLNTYSVGGMTLRDYFAAKVMAAMVSTIRGEADYSRYRSLARCHGLPSVSEWFAQKSYKQADAMLKAREVSHD